jgi:tetratricopeptide (TPR) repeat protein
MKSSPGTLAFGLLLSVAIPSSVALAADAGEQLMLEKANYWRSQQRLDLAGDVLNKLLALNPSQPDALYQQGMLALARGNRGDADQYFDRLRTLAAANSRAAELVAMLTAPAAVPVRASAAPATATAVAMTVAASEAASVAGGICEVPSDADSTVPATPNLVTASADSDDLISAAPAAPAKVPAHRAPGAVAIAADSDDLIPATPAAPTKKAPVPQAPAVALLPAPARPQRVAASAQTASDADTANPPPAAALHTADSSDLGGAAKTVQVAQVELQPPPPINGYQQNATITYSPNDTLEMLIDRNLETIEGESNPTLIAGLGFRGHSGDDGLNRLNEIGASIEGSFSPWYTGTARLAVLPVYLDASGAVSSSQLGEFGANPILAARGLPLVPSGQQTATGVGILGSYAYRDFAGQFGTSPLGFPVTNLIGNVSYTPKFFDDTLSVRFEGLRQPVTDSVLSYAGTHASLAAANAATANAFGNNATWGGVVKTGGHVTFYYDNQLTGAYGGAGLASVTGKNVAENTAIDALLGAYFRPWKTDDWSLRVGVSVFYASYNKNLSGFTFGQGGYFSPQNYEALTFPVEYIGHSGPWSWLASAALGVQHFNADSSPVFPDNRFAQTALASIPGSSAFIGGQTETGPAFNFKGQIEYLIDPSLAVGASAAIDNANNYVEGIGKIYLRKTFDWFAPIAKTDPTSIVARDQPMSRL